MHIPVNVTLDKSGSPIVWWRHQTETIFAFLTLVRGTTGGFPSQMVSKAGFHVSVDVSLNKHSSRRWFETPRCLMWRRCNGYSIGLLEISRVTLKDMHSANCKNFAVQSWCDGGKSLKYWWRPRCDGSPAHVRAYQRRPRAAHTVFGRWLEHGTHDQRSSQSHRIRHCHWKTGGLERDIVGIT